MLTYHRLSHSDVRVVNRQKREEIRATQRHRSFKVACNESETRHRILHSMRLQATYELDVSDLRYSSRLLLDIEHQLPTHRELRQPADISVV